MFPLPSPTRGEGKYIEIQEEIPSPLMGEGQGFGRELSRTVGVKMGFFHTLGEGKGGGDIIGLFFACGYAGFYPLCLVFDYAF
jgi:hypothetical protein